MRLEIHFKRFSFGENRRPLPRIPMDSPAFPTFSHAFVEEAAFLLARPWGQNSSEAAEANSLVGSCHPFLRTGHLMPFGATSRAPMFNMENDGKTNGVLSA